jgi:aspartyl-tRNA(Asn)/glutamyl-tRNA(Gln) amidotransferase subunit A
MNTVEKIQQYLDAIAKLNPKINAVIEVYEKDALAKANEIDKKGKNVGPLAGYVGIIKNNIAYRGKRLTCGSKMLENYKAPYNATVVEKLQDADAIIIGSANLDEFACGSDNTYSAYGPVHNPIDAKYVPGGSSGGSGASVKAGFCDFSLGSDTGGSIRAPAAFCGIVGFKPTYGAVSRHGLSDMAMSLDQIGPLANSVSDVRKIFTSIRGVDHRDSTTVGYRANDNVEKPKMAVIKEIVDGSSDEIKEQFQQAIQGEKIDYISVPEMADAVAIYYLNVFAEFSSAMQKYDGIRYGNVGELGENFQESIAEIRGSKLGEEVKRRIILGTYITSKEYVDAWYKKAIKARHNLKDKLSYLFTKYNAILTPTMTTLPWKIGEKSHNPLQMYFADIATVNANLAGIPAGSVPYGRNKFKIGIQVMSEASRDMQCLSVLEYFEQEIASLD